MKILKNHIFMMRFKKIFNDYPIDFNAFFTNNCIISLLPVKYARNTLNLVYYIPTLLLWRCK